MEKKIILFDLDGTLTDSGEGILNCGEIVLRHFGLDVPSRENMRCMVGPPLSESFLRFGVKQEDIAEAIEIYRAHYTKEGIFQNFPYPGIRQLLQKLHSQGHTLCVATSKPEYMAKIILEHFELAGYFHLICGASNDSVRSTKSEVIAYLLEMLPTRENIIMVGDTVYDVVGAAEFGIPAVGVAWGYGSVSEMLTSGATAVAYSTQELFDLL